MKHIKNEIYKEYDKTEKVNVSNAEKILRVPLYQISSKETKQLAESIEELIIHVYDDAKQLSNLAVSWPSRIVPSEMAQRFDIKKPLSPYKVHYLTSNTSFQATTLTFSSNSF